MLSWFCDFGKTEQVDWNIWHIEDFEKKFVKSINFTELYLWKL